MAGVQNRTLRASCQPIFGERGSTSTTRLCPTGHRVTVLVTAPVDVSLVSASILCYRLRPCRSGQSHFIQQLPWCGERESGDICATHQMKVWPANVMSMTKNRLSRSSNTSIITARLRNIHSVTSQFGYLSKHIFARHIRSWHDSRSSEHLKFKHEPF